MGNLMTAISTALSAMKTNTTAINTTSHNVANATNSSYSKQVTNISSSSSSSEQVGTGSYVSSTERVKDVYLEKQIESAWMDYGEAEVEDSVYQELAAYFPEVDGVTTTGLDTQIEEFFQAWTDLSTAIDNGGDISSAQSKVYELAESITSSLNEKSTALTNIQLDLNTQLEDTVESANTYIKEIYELNESIVQAYGQGQTPNDLLDKRDAAMAKLAELTNYETATKADGSVVIMLGGTTIVNGASGYSVLTTVSSADAGTNEVRDSRFESVGVTSSNSGSTVTLDNSVFTGGKIAGILESRDDTVADYKSELDSVANTLITVVNSIYNATQTAGVTDNKDFFSGTTASNISVDNSITSGSDISYTMYEDGDIAEILGNLKDMMVSTRVTSGTLTLTSDSTLPLSAGTDGELVINGVSIHIDETMTVKDLVNEINTHSSGQFYAVYNDVTNTFFIVSNEPLEITEQNLASGDSLLKSLGLYEEQISTSTVVYQSSIINPDVDVNATWTSQDLILDVPASTSGTVIVTIDNKEYKISWTAGDTISTTTWAISALDGSNSTPNLSITSYFSDDQKFHIGIKVGDSGVTGTISSFTISDESGNLTATMKLDGGNMTFDEYYKSVVSQLTSDVDSSSDTLSSYKSVLDQLQAMQDDITQVNTDEETAKAKVYQRAYDAAVKLLEIIDEMLNMLINHMGTSSSSTNS